MFNVQCAGAALCEHACRIVVQHRPHDLRVAAQTEATQRARKGDGAVRIAPARPLEMRRAPELWQMQRGALEVEATRAQRRDVCRLAAPAPAKRVGAEKNLLREAQHGLPQRLRPVGRAVQPLLARACRATWAATSLSEPNGAMRCSRTGRSLHAAARALLSHALSARTAVERRVEEQPRRVPGEQSVHRG